MEGEPKPDDDGWIDLATAIALLCWDDADLSTAARHLDYRGMRYLMRPTFVSRLVKGRPYLQASFRRFYYRTDIQALKERENGPLCTPAQAV